MSTHLNYPIFYLNNEDIDSKGNVYNKDIPTDVPVLLMLQSNSCHWCQKAKPEFQKFGDKYGYYIKSNENFRNLHNKYKHKLQQPLAFVATVNADDVRPDVFTAIDETFQGFPHFVAYYKGKRHTYNGERTAEQLKKFINTIRN